MNWEIHRASHHREDRADRTDQGIHRVSHHREVWADRMDQEIHRASRHREIQVSKMDQEIPPQKMQTKILKHLNRHYSNLDR